MEKLFIVVGTRPNFIKLAPIIREIEKAKINYRIIHTGQHYDETMSDVFFKELNIPKPHITFNVKSSYQGQQTSKIMSMFEICCLKRKPDYVMVLGDVTSTLAASIVVSKLPGIKLIHVESGERSFDNTMPEEVNRVVTDHLSDYLFCTNKTAFYNLKSENIPKEKIFVVGNTMIDSLLYNLPKIKEFKSDIPKPYIIFTLHRASNVDNKKTLEEILQALEIISKKIHVLFPIHPRTKKRIKDFKLEKYLDNIKEYKPMSYINFLSCVRKANIVMTDSGGLQVESAFLGVPCITLRNNTEHISTIEQHVNILVGRNKDKIIETFFGVLKLGMNSMYKDILNDGKTSERIIDILKGEL